MKIERLQIFDVARLFCKSELFLLIPCMNPLKLEVTTNRTIKSMPEKLKNEISIEILIELLKFQNFK